MSARYQPIETPDGYTVHLVNRSQALHVRVTHDGVYVAEAVCKSHTEAARWAKRKIRDHKRSLRILMRRFP